MLAPSQTSNLLFGENYRKAFQVYKTLQAVAQTIPDNTVYITPGGFWYHTEWTATYINYAGGNSGPISFPVNNPKWVVISIDINSNIHITNGVESINPVIPELDITFFPIAAILLDLESTSITSNAIFDVRSILKLSVKNNNSIQKVEVSYNNIYKGVSKNLNFIEGEKIFITTDYNENNQMFDVFISAASLVYGTGNYVTPQTVYGMIPFVGESEAFSREDHNHGTPHNTFIQHNLDFDHTLLHSNENDPDSNEKEALIGSVGIPSETNRYVTESDYRLLPSIKTLLANSFLERFKIVSNKVLYANNNTFDDILGITLNEAEEGQLVTIQLNGSITNPNWDWNITDPIYLGTSGNLTQNIQEITGKKQRVAIPITPTKIYLSVLDPL